MPPAWSLPLLRCLECGGDPLVVSDSGLVCEHCSQRYPEHDGVVDFLHDLHATPAVERQAVEALDASLFGAEYDADDPTHQRYRQAVEEARAHALDLLARRPIDSDSVVLELGADVGWTSGVLIDHGCRVLAVDISDHLRASCVNGSPSACLLQADMNRVPIVAESVGVVWATACVHHSWSLTATFDEIDRVLRPGGALYLCLEPMPSRLRWVFGFGFGRQERELGINETWVPRSRWLAQCRRVGLDAEIVFPELDHDRIARRLRNKGLPTALTTLVRPFLRWLQVSLHLVATKPA